MPDPAAESLFATLAARRPREAAHSRRVSAYAVRLANQYGLSPGAIETIAEGALLHDVGKLLVARRILDKPARLNDHEWVTLKGHPRAGADLVETRRLDPGVAEIVLHHHERHDGTGYPHRLSGRKIQWMVRIVSVMDAFDALTSPRQYRSALSIDAARALIAREAGSRFCPWVVAGLLSLPHALLEPPPGPFSDGYIQDGPAVDAANAPASAWLPWHANEGVFELPAIMTT